jgi:hypothetical protein
MSAATPVILGLLGAETLGTERRLRSLVIEWPSLAAALGDLCDEHDVPPVRPLRQAQAALRARPEGER